MADRLRSLAERPLDPRVARAILVLACSALAGLAALLALAGTEADRAATPREAASARPVQAAPSPAPEAGHPPAPTSPRRARPAQDPQDRRGTAAARRAARELSGHRALQHVPYAGGEVTIRLVGARGGRAVLRVSGASVGAARRGWRSFLRRYNDSGRTYVPIFDGRARRARGGA